MASEKPKIDVRTVDRYMDKGLLDRDEVQKMMKALPDDTVNAQTVETELYEGEITEKGNGLDSENDK